MLRHKVFLFSETKLSSLGQSVKAYFEGIEFEDMSALSDVLRDGDCNALVFDSISSKLNFDICNELLQLDGMESVPLVVLAKNCRLEDKVNAIEAGCDDLVDEILSINEVFARITKSIFNQVASKQLSVQLNEATQAAKAAIHNSSDLGANVHFLIAINDCHNLDELGQQFFAVMKRYGLSCSLQMRSTIEIKNMEVHGMAKDLESQLMTQLKDAGRFVDFGKRTVVNFDRISLLIRNMPLDSPERYGAIKDNVLTLLNGVNARVKALEDQRRLADEHEALKQLSEDIRSEMTELKSAYHQITNSIVAEVEAASAAIQHRVPHLALVEKDEKFLEELTDRCVRETNRIFNDGLKVDDCFSHLEKAVANTLSIVEHEADAGMSAKEDTKDGGDNLEIF